MSHESPAGVVSTLAAPAFGVFRGRAAVDLGVSRKQLTALLKSGVVVRDHPDVYRMTAVPRSSEQRLRAALLWAGDASAAAVRSAGEVFALDGVAAPLPEIVVPRTSRLHSPDVVVHQSDDRRALMVRTVKGLRVTGIEATLMALAHALDAESLEVACEDARRRNLTSVAALDAYLARFGGSGRAGSRGLRGLLRDLDPEYPSASTLEVKTRRLLAAHGFTDFRREFPLAWNGRVYRFDFAFERGRTILETNGRRWHDDPRDFERDNEKWSVPARHGYRLLFATWAKVVRSPELLVEELAASLSV